MPRRSFRRGGGGTVRVQLAAEELRILSGLAAEMAELLAEGVPDNVRARLYPPAYHGDPAKEAEYRRLMASDLEERKAADLATLRATLERKPIVLQPEEAHAWLGALQDMRLALGTILGIERDGWEAETTDDPEMAVLHYLGYLQDSLVRLML